MKVGFINHLQHKFSIHVCFKKKISVSFHIFYEEYFIEFSMYFQNKVTIPFSYCTMGINKCHGNKQFLILLRIICYCPLISYYLRMGMGDFSLINIPIERTPPIRAALHISCLLASLYFLLFQCKNFLLQCVVFILNCTWWNSDNKRPKLF